MVAARQAGGPGGRGSFRFRWDGARIVGQVTAQVQDAADDLARDLEAYLHSELHRDTGDMADKAFARVSFTGSRIVITAGSESGHTIYHELRYHPQLRETMDIFAPQIAARIRAAMRGG